MRTLNYSAPHASLAILLALLLSGLSPAAKGRPSARTFDPVQQEIHGWTVHVDPALLEGQHQEEGARALSMLANHLERVSLLVTGDRLEDLRSLEVWIEYEHPSLATMQYHPSVGWLRRNGHDERLVKKVHIPRARNLLSREQLVKHPAVVLHELAHAYHDQILGFDDERVLAAFSKAQAAGSYEHVLSHRGNTVRHYALTDHKEYFAEGTEAYFYRNDFYPFVRAELDEFDPGLHELYVEISGVSRMISLELAALAVVALSSGDAEGSERPPNIVYMMVDELAYFELSHMGNPWIRTPRVDRMAEEGIRFTEALAGAPVCAPLRCSLMTGKHMGHASVRANDGGTPLRAEEPTIASLLKEQGYATGGFGKWGAGGRGSTGVPERHGFDVFFGYYDQVHAHSYYPPYLIRNSEEVVLDGNIGGRSGATYAHHAIMDAAIEFIRENRERPFFCYLPVTPPHGMYDIPASDPAWKQYVGDDWIRDDAVAQDVKNYAAMVTMLDNDLGRVLDLLAELGLEEDTLVFFTGDNGGQDRFRSDQHPRGFFGPNVDPRTGTQFRGGKGNLYEGGLRIPFLARWPGTIAPGTVSDLCFYHPDIMPTLAELTGAHVPDETDGLSIVPELIGAEAARREQAQHEFLYWEFGSQVAVRSGDWKAIRPKPGKAWELYELSSDPSEASDVADRHPEQVARMRAYAERSHEPARPGTYTSRDLHERDRQAKWGTAQQPKPMPKPRAAHRLDSAGLIPFGQLTVTRFSSENAANDRRAKYAIDGDPATMWHSRWSGELARHPHELVIDLGAARDVQGFRYLARQDNSWNGAFADTQFWVGDSMEFSGEPVLVSTFRKTRAPQPVECAQPVRGRYVRILILSEVNGGAWASAADIGIVSR